MPSLRTVVYQPQHGQNLQHEYAHDCPIMRTYLETWVMLQIYSSQIVWYRMILGLSWRAPTVGSSEATAAKNEQPKKIGAVVAGGEQGMMHKYEPCTQRKSMECIEFHPRKQVLLSSWILKQHITAEMVLICFDTYWFCGLPYYTIIGQRPVRVWLVIGHDYALWHWAPFCDSIVAYDFTCWCHGSFMQRLQLLWITSGSNECCKHHSMA